MSGFSFSTVAGRRRIAGLAALLSAIFLLPGRGEAATLAIGYVGPQNETPAPFGPPGNTIKQEGLAGGRLGIADNETTGRFTGQNFELVPHLLGDGAEPADAIRALADRGLKFVVAALDAPDLLKAADAARERSITLFNAKAPD